jgi:aldose 1-epimerase
MSERFITETAPDPFWSGDVVVLKDREVNSWARIVPALGCNVVSFGAEIGERVVETFLQPSDESPSYARGQYGAPVLYPFPNRLRDGRAQFGGRQITVDRPTGQPHAIHGLVRDRRWRIDRLSSEAEAAVLQCSIETDAEILRQFPFPFRLTLTIRLTGRSLRVSANANNLGDSPLPMGFGWHPYFRLPLVPGGDRRQAIVRIPARQIWQLDDTLVPTGEIVAPSPERDFRSPHPLGGIYLDDVYTALERPDGVSACELTDPSSGALLRISAGATFREWVVYAPPARPTICFEPYTCTTDAFNLAEQDIDAGVIVLKPGEEWSDWMEVDLGVVGQ